MYISIDKQQLNVETMEMKYDKENILEVTVNGVKFEKFSDFTRRATFATNLETGETKPLTTSGYCSSVTTIRRKIKEMFF